MLEKERQKMAKHHLKGAGLIAAVALAATLLPAQGASASNPVQGQPRKSARTASVAFGFKLASTYGGKCLSPAGGRVDNNAFTVVFNCDGDPSRVWYLVDKGNSIYQILNLNSGKCLTPAGGGGANNTETVIFTCDNDPSRLWRLIDKGNSDFLLMNNASGKCLSPAGGLFHNNNPTVIYNCDLHTARLWYMSVQ